MSLYPRDKCFPGWERYIVCDSETLTTDTKIGDVRDAFNQRFVFSGTWRKNRTPSGAKDITRPRDASGEPPRRRRASRLRRHFRPSLYHKILYGVMYRLVKQFQQFQRFQRSRAIDHSRPRRRYLIPRRDFPHRTSAKPLRHALHPYCRECFKCECNIRVPLTPNMCRA